MQHVALGPPSPSVRPDPAVSQIVLVNEPVSYAAAWTLQTRLHEECRLGLRGDTVLILEHQPVYTLGRSAERSHWGGDEHALRAKGAAVHAVNRGGSVTYHGPGQIVAYPILRLARHASGPRQLVWLLEEVLLRVLQRWGLNGHRLAKKPGVWISEPYLAKIACIGIRVEGGVTLHGFALNVDMDVSPFALIQPCGLHDCCVTSMGALLDHAPGVQAVKLDVADCFREVLTVKWLILDMRSADDFTVIDQAQAMRDYART
jgi:lipoyl(octanoyl) transferase